MILPQAQGHRYLVIGLGISGIAAVRALQASRAEVWAWDDNENLRAQAITEGIPVHPLESVNWSSLKALVLSPGIPHLYPQPHISAQKAHAANVPIICDIDLLAQAQPHAHYVGVTGTNGKSTTTALIGHLLKTAKQPCQIGGNIGAAALALESFRERGTYVLELSSYQLERVPHLNLNIAVLLNITPDHLARHGGMAGYIAAKKNIFERAGRNFAGGVIGIDDPYCQAIYEELKENCPMTAISTQTRADIYVEKGILYERGQPVFNLSEHFLPLGIHNAQNAAAAYAAGKLAGIRCSDLVKGMESFKGLAHRLEPIGQLKGIQFINDSKATNAAATAKALRCFNNIYWILGGQAKEGGLGGLETFYPRVRHAFLIGEASREFAISLKGKVNFTSCDTLEKATQEAFKHAEKDAENPVILLSPACASLDQFKNFEHRGEAFREVFKKLKME